MHDSDGDGGEVREDTGLLENPAGESQLDLIGQYAESYVIGAKHPEVSRGWWLSMVASKALLLPTSSLSGIAYLALAEASAGGNKWLDALYKCCIIVSFGTGSAWGWYNILEEFSPVSEEEKLILDRRLDFYFGLVALVLGFGAAIPTSYLAYLYNSNKFWVVVDYFATVGLHAFGFFKFMESAYRARTLRENMSLEGQTRKRAVQRLFSMLPDTWVIPRGEPLLSQLDATLANTRSVRDAAWCSQLSLPLPLAIMIAFTLTVPVAITKGYFARDAATKIDDNQAFSFFLAFYAALPESCISLYTILCLCRGNASRGTSLFRRVMPRVYFALLMVIIITGLISIGSGIPILTERLKQDNLGAWASVIAIWGTLASMVTKIFMSSDFAEQLGQDLLFASTCSGEKKMHYITEMNSQKLKRLIDCADEQTITVFYDNLSQGSDTVRDVLENETG